MGSVKLEWNLSWEPDITGYRVHYGSESGNYTETVDIGYKVNTELTGLPVGETLYFAVTVYNTYGLESVYSNEVSTTISAPAEDPDSQTGSDSDGDGLSDYFEASYGAGSDLDPFADLDGDGLIALGEFAHGLDPTTAQERSSIESKTLPVGEERYLAVRYLVDPAAQDFVTILVERSTDLSVSDAWQAAQTVQVSATPSTENPDLLEIVARSLSPMTAQAREFLRFRYEVVVP